MRPLQNHKKIFFPFTFLGENMQNNNKKRQLLVTVIIIEVLSIGGNPRLAISYTYVCARYIEHNKEAFSFYLAKLRGGRQWTAHHTQSPPRQQSKTKTGGFTLVRLQGVIQQFFASRGWLYKRQTSNKNARGGPSLQTPHTLSRPYICTYTHTNTDYPAPGLLPRQIRRAKARTQ